mmetsp:Transcript_20301/g.14982  ORF Transcript_20301/g.14982 Transcript_20301/m.14982 type:complete len:86 (-) Transcript_20301:89-346(-)
MASMQTKSQITPMISSFLSGFEEVKMGSIVYSRMQAWNDNENSKKVQNSKAKYFLLYLSISILARSKELSTHISTKLQSVTLPTK